MLRERFYFQDYFKTIDILIIERCFFYFFVITHSLRSNIFISLIKSRKKYISKWKALEEDMKC